MNSSVTCPNCQAQIEITEVISSQLRATIRGELETELSAIRQRLKQQQDDLARRQGDLQKKAEAVEEQVRTKLRVGMGEPDDLATEVHSSLPSSPRGTGWS